MKKIKYLVISFVFFFAFSFSVLAESSNFEPFMGMNADVTEDEVRITLGFTGEELMSIQQTLTYDSNYLSFVSVEELDNFNVTTSLEEDNGKYRTLNFLVDSDYSFNESYYCEVVFQVKDKFKKNKKTDIFFYNYMAAGPEKVKYRNSGYIVTLTRENASEVSYYLNYFNKNTKTKYWFINHLYLFIIIGIVIIGVVLLIVLLPSRRKKEKRDETVENNIKRENYDPNTSNVKIDPKVIDEIGKVEKPVDMSEAIIVNEDIKPFGDIVSKNDAEMPMKKEEKEQTANIINPFTARNPEDYSEKGKEDNSEEKLEILDNQVVETPAPPANNNNELISINPTSFENVEMPKLNEDISFPVQKEEKVETLEDNSENTSSNNNNQLLSLIFLFLLTLSSVFLTDVKATEYNVENIRKALVNNEKYSKSLDYNGDGVIDILDLIETKDLTNCNFSNLLSTDPGFAEIHGQSNNLISSDKNFEPPVSKKGKKTTTKKASNTETKKNNTNSKSTKANTTKATTVKANSSNNNNATKTLKQTKKITSKKIETVTYNISVRATNGSVSETTFTLQANKSKTLTLTPNSGYLIDKNASSCRNVSFSFNGSNKVILSNPTADASCNIVFNPRGDIKVTLKYYTGKGDSTKTTPVINYGSKSINNGGVGKYNTTWSTGLVTPVGYKVKANPTCGTYANNTFTITVPSESTTCELYFDPILYSLTVYVPGQSTPINTGSYAVIYYNESKKIEFAANTSFSKVNCTGGESPRLVKNGLGPYQYSFTYKHTELQNAICNIS